MPRFLRAVAPFALFSMTLISEPLHAQQPPVKCDVKFQFNVNFGPPRGNGQPYKAPWYLYFPVEPTMNSGYTRPTSMNQVGMPLPNRFPNWPCQFPPDAGGCSAEQQACPPGVTTQTNYPYWSGPTHNPNVSSSNIVLTGSTAPFYWQPASYPPYRPTWQPYYWYGR